MTTREPRQEEKQGVDYTFLSKEEFIALEKRGELLESGVFDGKPIPFSGVQNKRVDQISV